MGKDNNLAVLPEVPILPVGLWQTFWNNPRVTWYWRPIFSTPLVALFAWLLANFFQLRGFVNVTASRVDLAIAAFCISLLTAIMAANLPKWRWRVGTVGVLLIILAAFGLDRFTLPKLQKPSTVPAPTELKSLSDPCTQGRTIIDGATVDASKLPPGVDSTGFLFKGEHPCVTVTDSKSIGTTKGYDFEPANKPPLAEPKKGSKK